MSKKPYDIFVVETYEHDGQEKSSFHRVGVAFETKDGGFSCQPYPGVALSGRFLILPRKDKPHEAS